MDDLGARCAAVFARILEVDALAIGEDASPETIEEWDSLAHVKIILALEEEFGISAAPVAVAAAAPGDGAAAAVCSKPWRAAFRYAYR